MSASALELCLLVARKYGVPDEVATEVFNLIELSATKGEVVTNWECIQELLLKHGLAHYAHIPPEFVGVHPKNRSKHGVSGSDSQHHGVDILLVGWSWKKASDAVCFELGDGSRASEAIASNKTIVDASSGLIPMLLALKYLSIGAGHTNTFLRAVKAGCRSVVEKNHR